MHLEKVNIARGINAGLGKRVYTWVFEAHHIVLGDMNAAWDVMSVRPSLERRDGSTPASTYGWVNPKTHQHATRESGTYLPGVEEVKVPRFPGDVVAIKPSTFDNVVVHRPLTVYALPERRDRHAKGPRQLGAKFVPCKLPRTLMTSLPPDGWPSDHTSVQATVRSHGGPSCSSKRISERSRPTTRRVACRQPQAMRHPSAVWPSPTLPLGDALELPLAFLSAVHFLHGSLPPCVYALHP